MRDHRQLRAFQLADELVIAVYQATRSFPSEELYGLRSQIRRSAVSVPSNIVEGCSRLSNADYVRFLEIAFGSLRELSYQLDLSRRLGFINEESWKTCESLFIETDKVLVALIRSKRNPS
jgi:four helix bundle protein